MVFMFLKGLNSKPGGTNAQPAVKEYFNGQKTKDGVNILILGTDGRIGEKLVWDANGLHHGGQCQQQGRQSEIGQFHAWYSGSYRWREQQTDPEYQDYYDQKLNTAFTIGEQNNNQRSRIGPSNA